MKTKPDLGFWKLWNLSFGFFGVQIAYALQSSQVSRIFSTIGADPHTLSFFWILPPLMGLVVQPVIGSASDRTWTRFGRRLPYLILGAAVAIVVMCLLPNAGSLGLGLSPWVLGLSQAIVFGLVMLMLLDTSINMAMQPFKMLVGDMVNEKQKGLAYSIQSFLCNAGSLVGYLAPFVLAWFLSNTAPEGVVPPTVTWAFYIGAIILLFCVVYSLMMIREWPPKLYNEYNGGDEKAADDGAAEKKDGMLKLLIKAPSVFWTVGIVQFFCWAAFLYMWSYSTDGIAGHAFGVEPVETVEAVIVDGKEYPVTNLFNAKSPVIEKGELTLAGITIDGSLSSPSTVVANGDTIIKDGSLFRHDGVAVVKLLANGPVPLEGEILVDGEAIDAAKSVAAVSALSLIEPGTTLTLAHNVTTDKNTGEIYLEETSDLPYDKSAKTLEVRYKKVLNVASKKYQEAGDWNGVLLAVQAAVAVLWAMAIPRFRSRRLAYSVSLLIGAAGFLSIFFFTNQYLLCVSYGLAGVAWAAMLALPFTLLTNALKGNNIGTYLGLFNCTICLPQIIAAIVGGSILSLMPLAANGTPQTVCMLYVSGVLLLIGAAAVWVIKEK